MSYTKFIWLYLLLGITSSAAFSYTDEEAAFIKQEFDIDVSAVSVPAEFDSSKQTALSNSLKSDLEDQFKAAKRADEGVAAWVGVAAYLLEQKGHWAEASALKSDYWNYYQSFYQQLVLGSFTDLYDHPPMSQWLADAYRKVEAILGERIMILFHLDDILEIDYGGYVVFRPRGDNRVSPAKPWGQNNYKYNFCPFAEGVTYWVTYGVCLGASYGMGVIVACGPIAVGAEKLMDLVSPNISNRIYLRYNP